MNTKKHIFALFIAILFLGSVLPATITFTPANPVPGQMITFTLNPTHPNMVADRQLTWVFADGTQLIRPITQLSATHAYASTGVYEVSARYYYYDVSGVPQYFVETIIVRVSAPVIKAISFSPGDPNTCEPVNFQASGFISPTLRWDFGDGTVQAGGGAAMVHAYSSSGSFLVRAFDNNGSDVNPATATVIVNNKRSINLLTAQPKTGIPVSFQASGFISTCLLWDFGDGQPRVKGTAAANHIYANPGSFQIKVLDNCGESLCLAGIGVTVEASQGPLAPFTVSYGILRFENGKTSLSIFRNTPGLTAYADLKFEGSGILLVEWRVDGVPFKTATQALGFANQVTIDSGKIPGLPTVVVGPHTVSLHIVQPHVSFIIPAITYFVMLGVQPPPPDVSNQAAVVTSVTPATVERGKEGKEYTLQLLGKNFNSATVTNTGLGIADYSFNYIDSQHGTMKIFVPKTAKLGDRLIFANNGQGSSTGPGKITVTESQAPPPVNTCTDSCTLSREKIDLTSLEWYYPEHLDQADAGYWGHEGSAWQPAKFKLVIVNDLSTMEWLMNPVYDYIEVRFYKAKTNQLFMVKRLEGPATSLRLDVHLLLELFANYDSATSAPGPPLYDHTMDVDAPEYQDTLYYSWTGDVQKKQAVYQNALQAADVVWQVAGFRRFACVYNSKKPTIPIKFDQTIEIGLSDIGMFNLPDRPTGIKCPDTNLSKPNASVIPNNLSLNQRNAGKKDDKDKSSINYVGDTFTITGSVDLAISPYGSYSPVSNLFIDWGDGSGAKNIGKIFSESHVYATASYNYTIRIFMLSEDDNQKPTNSFLSRLSHALMPPATSSSGSDPYGVLLGHQMIPIPQGDPPPETFAQVMQRAYMLYCNSAPISSHDDTCAAGPLKLKSINIISFPGHNLNPVADSDSGANSAVLKVTQTEFFLYSKDKIDAVATTCDKYFFARAKLKFVGKGNVELLWRVDDHVVDTNREDGLKSEERANLTEVLALDCSHAIVSAKPLDTSVGALPVSVLGGHDVSVQARVVADATATNLYQYAADMVFSLFSGAGGPEPEPALMPHGPSALPVNTGGHASDPLLQSFQAAAASGQAVPQVGFLNPDKDTDGAAVIYLNDSLPPDMTYTGESTDWVISPHKRYQVNEVRNLLGCRVLIPSDSPGKYFELTDMMDSAVLNDDDTYSASGLLGLLYYTNTGSYQYKPVPFAFNKWVINPADGKVADSNGPFDIHFSEPNFKFPSFVNNVMLRRLRGGVSQSVGQPLLATFDFDLNCSILNQIQLEANHSASILGAEGRLAVSGDWLAAGLTLDKTEIGKSQTFIKSSAVTIDMSLHENPAQYQGAGANWMGVYFGQPTIIPFVWLFPANAGFNMDTILKPWVLKTGGLSGESLSTAFTATIEQGTFAFDSLDFSVTGNSIAGIYNGVKITPPWLNQTVAGNAVLQQTNNGSEMVPVLYLTTPQLQLTYSDPLQRGKLVLTASQFRLKTVVSLGIPALECQAMIDLQCEDKPFASVAINDFDFRFDGRAMFGVTLPQKTIPLSGVSQFGPFAVNLNQVTVTAPDQGAECLSLAFDTMLEYGAGDMSAYVPTTPTKIRYAVSLSGQNYTLAGPTSKSEPITLEFPQTSKDFKCAIQPEYKPQAGDGVMSGKRFQTKIPLSLFGVQQNIEATFILGNNASGSYFLTTATWQIPAPGIPLSPIPFSINKFVGGFGYGFKANTLAVADENAQPDSPGTVAFKAGLGLVTSDGFTLKGEAALTGDSGGNFQMDFTGWSLLSMGNFGGQLKYASKTFSGCVYGHLKMLEAFPVIDFSLGDGKDLPNSAAVKFSFSDSDWFVNAGSEGTPITASIWGIKAKAYLMLGKKVGLKTGGRISVVIPPGFDDLAILPYFYGNLGVDMTITPTPHFTGHFYAQGGVWLPLIPNIEGTAEVTIEATHPTYFTVCLGGYCFTLGDED